MSNEMFFINQFIVNTKNTHEVYNKKLKEPTQNYNSRNNLRINTNISKLWKNNFISCKK